MAKTLTELIFDAVVKEATGRKDDVHDALATIASMAENDNEVTRQLLSGNLQNQHWMQTMIQELALEGRSALRDTADPVGKSVKTMSYGDQRRALTIDEPVAVRSVPIKKLRWWIAPHIVSNWKECLRPPVHVEVRLIDQGVVVSGESYGPSRRAR